MIERVRKILAKTEDRVAAPAEAELLSRRRAASWRSTTWTCPTSSRRKTASQSWTEDDIFETGKWTLEDNLAYGIVSRYFFVEGFFAGKWANGKHRKVLRFFGAPHNVATAKWAFTALHEAFDRLLMSGAGRTGGPASDRRIFISGVASGFARR